MIPKTTYGIDLTKSPLLILYFFMKAKYEKNINASERTLLIAAPIPPQIGIRNRLDVILTIAPPIVDVTYI